MARYAIIENDEVVNVIVADAEFIEIIKIAAVECADNICPGWKYINDKFVEPETIIDETLAE